MFACSKKTFIRWKLLTFERVGITKLLIRSDWFDNKNLWGTQLLTFSSDPRRIIALLYLLLSHWVTPCICWDLIDVTLTWSGGSWCQKCDLTILLAISDHFKNNFCLINIFIGPTCLVPEAVHHTLAFLNFVQIFAFVKVVTWNSLRGLFR